MNDFEQKGGRGAAASACRARGIRVFEIADQQITISAWQQR